jgi:uncharacterized protein YecT (DUF1311 family)
MRSFPRLMCVSLLFFYSNCAVAIDCKNAQTQYDFNKCTSLNLESETKRINISYEKLRKKLTATQNIQLKAVQLAWIKFKDLSCKFEASGIEGGSAYPMVFNSCLAEMTRTRTKELDVWLNCHEGEYNCPAW